MADIAAFVGLLRTEHTDGPDTEKALRSLATILRAGPDRNNPWQW